MLNPSQSDSDVSYYWRYWVSHACSRGLFVMVVSKSEEVQSHATLSYLHECRPLFILQIH
jgi:hypothetical protein